jgi:hypothetical protein
MIFRQWERLVPRVKEMLARRPQPSIAAIATVFGVSNAEVHMAKRWLETRQRPKWPAKRRKKDTGQGNPNRARFRELMPRVLKRRDVKKQSFERIARDLGVSVATVHRAYDAGHPERAEAALVAGTNIDRGSYSRLGPKKYERMRRLLIAGKKPAAVAKPVGVGPSTVGRVRQQLINDGQL